MASTASPAAWRYAPILMPHVLRALARLVPLALLSPLALACSSPSPAAEATGDAASRDASDASPTGDASDDAPALADSLGGGGGPDCQNACCATPRPVAGGACATADAGLVCPTSTTCAGGLILPWSLTCVSGAWKASGGACDVGSGVADNGCPSSQPTKGSACTLPEGTWCQYALVCAPKDCDAGAVPDAGDGATSGGTGCASVAGKVGPAFCRSGAWDTTPLGSCP
jgi:hypothetical protein